MSDLPKEFPKSVYAEWYREFCPSTPFLRMCENPENVVGGWQKEKKLAVYELKGFVTVRASTVVEPMTAANGG